MKVRDTSRGRMYAVSSNPGCTVINGDMAVEIPAGGQSVILALDKKLIIDGDDNAKFVEVRWGTNAAVGSRPAPSWIGDVVDGIVSIVGEGKFDVNYIPAENKLYLAFAFDVAEAQITEVENLLEGVLPKDVVSEIDPFPIDYTKAKYLQNYDYASAYIETSFSDYNRVELTAGWEIQSGRLFMSGTPQSVRKGVQRRDVGKLGVMWGYSSSETVYAYGDESSLVKIIYDSDSQEITVNGKMPTRSTGWGVGSESPSNLIFFNSSPYKLYEARVSSSDRVANFVPALDQIGAPCLFDTISRTPYYNKGLSDFSYELATEASKYKKIKYLSCNGEHRVNLQYTVNDQTGLLAEFETSSANNKGAVIMAAAGTTWQFSAPFISNGSVYCGWPGIASSELGKPVDCTALATSSVNFCLSRTAEFVTENEQFFVENLPDFTRTWSYLTLCCSQFNADINHPSYSLRYFNGKIYRIAVSQGTEIIHDFYPYVDSNGVGCLYDEIEKKPYYSKDQPFIVEDAALLGDEESVATTYSLRAPRQLQYAQMTERGIRRLYHVPKGYNGTKDEYAAEHGFKLLVETPQPEEGCWAPVWHDREDCIELEWVETEPPTKEEPQIEEIENA